MARGTGRPGGSAGGGEAPARAAASLVLACFFVSGAAALLYQVSWLRVLVLVFGTTGLAVATLLAAFMAGLALGSFVLGQLVDRWGRPLLLYGLLELGIGGYALLVPSLFHGLIPAYRWAWASFHPAFWTFSLVRFGLACSVLLMPTTLMGGTLPVLSRFFAHAEEIGYRVGLLYALNTLGSVCGAFAAGFFLLPRFGLAHTMLIGVALNGLAGGVVLLLAGRRETPSATAPTALQPRRHAQRESALGRVVLLVFGVSGLVAMAYEVAWTRLLTLVLGSSTYSFTIMVTTFILGIALGSALMARPADRIRSPVPACAVVEFGIGTATFFGLLLAHRLPIAFLWLFQWTDGRTALFVLGQFAIAGLVMLMPALLLGAVFPVVVRALTRDLAAIGHTIGTAYAANTIGAVLGAFGAGFLFLPRLGIQGTILAGVALNAVAAALLLGVAPGLVRRRRLQLVGGALVTVPLFLVAAPKWDRLVMSSGVYREAPTLLSLYGSPNNALRLLSNFDLLYYREGVTATVTVVEHPVLEDRRHLVLAVDGKVDASTAQDMATQVLSAHLPLMLAPKLERVLVIGWGSGVTVGSAELYPVKALTAVEIEPAVIDASRAFGDANHGPLRDPRLQLIVDDGRNYLLAARDSFDVIISEPSNPWMSGPAKLFTREFFELGAAHLPAGGVFCQWLQLYGLDPAALRTLVRTFARVFPYTYLVQSAEADVLLLGSRVPFALDMRSLRRAFTDPRIAADLARVGIRAPADLLASVRLGPREIAAFSGGGPLNTDDNGLIEFAAPRALYRQTIEANVAMVRGAARGVIPYVSGLNGSRDEADVLFRLSGSLVANGREDEAVQTLHRALDISPSARAYWLLGEALSRRGNEGGALDAWARALRLDPTHFPSLLSRARGFITKREWANAQSELTRATQVAPHRAIAWTLTALVAHREGREAAARQALALTLARRAGPGSDDDAPLETMFRHYLADRLNAPARGGRHEDSPELAAFSRDMRTWREALHWTTASPRLGAVDSLWAVVDRFFPEDRDLRSLLETELLRPLTAFYTGVNAYLLGFYSQAIAVLGPVERESGGSLPLASYYLGLAELRSGDSHAGTKALSRFLKGVPPARRTGAWYADAERRLEEATRLRGGPALHRSGGRARSQVNAGTGEES
jgi:spermidine synthase